MASRPLTARLAALPLLWFAIVAGVLALTVSGLAGGLDPVASPGAPQVRPSMVNEGSPWNITVLTGRVVNDLSPIKPRKDGDRWFIVLATIEVTSDESRNDMRQALRVPAVAGLLDEEPAHVLMARDGTEVGYLNPGMPEVLGFVWEQRSDVPLTAMTDVDIWGKTHRISSLTGRMEWLDLAVRATVHVPVQDRRK
jgi:hypothetical protein